jgi:beta-glucosidase
MGAGLTRGRRRTVMACVKHFALNSIDNSRFKVDVVDEHALHEVYLPHFMTIVDEHAPDSVMSSRAGSPQSRPNQ